MKNLRMNHVYGGEGRGDVDRVTVALTLRFVLSARG